jgi:DNA-binding GntR family transcriptional regulator
VAADPMYRQIADDLRRQIEEGSLPPGAQLRTELELREKYNASRNTVRDAVKWLITRGLVETRPGQGTFVVETIVPYVTTLTGDPRTGFGGGEDDIYKGRTKIKEQEAQRTRVEVQQADPATVHELQLDEGATVVSRHQQRFIKATATSAPAPWSLQTSFYPMWLVVKGAERLIQATNITQGTVMYLADALGIKQAGWRDTIAVRAPDEIETAYFRLPDDGRISVIETRRTAFDDLGRPVRLTVSVYPANRNQFAINVGAVPDEVAYPTEADEPDSTTAGPSDGAAVPS